jgi:hypothetical protein
VLSDFEQFRAVFELILFENMASSKERAADGAGTSKGWNKLLAAGAEGL